MKRKQQKNSFTLVELVVVAVTLVVLLGVMVPAVAQSVDAAKGKLCLSQLANLGKITTSYSDSFGGAAVLPKMTVGKNKVIVHSLFLYWKSGLIPNAKAAGSSGDDYYSKDFFCPELVTHPKLTGRKYKNSDGMLYSSNCTYGIRRDSRNSKDPGSVNGYFQGEYIKLSNLPNPAGFNFYGCSTRRSTKLGIRFYNSKQASGDFLAGVHEGKANIWAADGHVAAITPADLQKVYGGSARCWNTK